jgi:hypothetical protein
MNLEINLSDEFGPRLADGAEALAFRSRRIDPYVGLCGQIILDFSGIRNANSSFINALVSGAIEQHGPGVLEVFVFKGCNPVIRVLVASAISMGVEAASQHSLE